MGRQTAAVTSKGQITIPKEVRRQLNLREGDRVEFVMDGVRMVIGRAKEGANPFQAYIGVLPAFRSKRAINSWLSAIRDAPTSR
jgi:AbrB family looped-hinge helix DNA binding protein